MCFCLSCRAVEYGHNALIIAYSLPFIQLSLFSKQLPLIVSNMCELGATQYNQILLFQQHVINIRIRLHTISEHWTHKYIDSISKTFSYYFFLKEVGHNWAPMSHFCVYLNCQSVCAWKIWKKHWQYNIFWIWIVVENHFVGVSIWSICAVGVSPVKWS